MYLEHFGLAEAPFRITPHTDFFFAGANRGATLEALMYAITRDEGIVRVTGEVGSGKTMLCRVLMERLPESVQTAYIANPTLTREDMLHALADELHLHLPAERPNALLKALQEHLITGHADGRQVVVLIDEAHAMPAETLEEVRLLSNLETKRHKLLQIVLFGQPELDQVLDRPQMRQLKDRITQRFSLAPLVRADVAAYLDFRMRAAGYRGPSVFGDDAIKLIASASGGLTRRINILADKALLAAFAGGSHLVSAKEVRAAVRDAAMAMPGETNRRLLVAATLVAAAAAGALLWPRAELPAPRPPAAPAGPAPVTAPSPSPLPTAPAAAPTASGTETTGPGTAPATGNRVAEANGLATDGVPPPARASAPAPDAVGTAVAATELPAAVAAPMEIEPLLARTREWLATVPDEHWFLQLLSAESGRLREVERFLGRSAQIADPNQLRAYSAMVGDNRRIGIIYGDYASVAEANAALKSLPEPLRAHGAFPRQVRRLKP